MTEQEGWQEHCTGTYHFMPKGKSLSWCGSVWRDSSCEGPGPIYPCHPVGRACPHCIAVELPHPAKWQKQSRGSR